jgi:hypothetical protein
MDPLCVILVQHRGSGGRIDDLISISQAIAGCWSHQMRLLPALSALAVSFFLQGASSVQPSQGELHYRATLTFRGAKTPVVTHFVVMPTPIAETRNKVKKPRMGGWRIEGVQRKEDGFSQAAVLARVGRLLYFSGPAPGLIQKPIFIRYNDKPCQVWQVPAPLGLHVYAYLVEVAPGILALSYCSGNFGTGEWASVELQLENFHIQSGTAPAENGTALLTTLQLLAKAPDQALEDDNPDGSTETIE